MDSGTIGLEGTERESTHKLKVEGSSPSRSTRLSKAINLRHTL